MDRRVRDRPGQGKERERRDAEAPPSPLLLPAIVHAQAQPSAVPAGGALRAFLAPNGATVVNINAANAAGLSHNRYQSFNVNAAGLVLNNGNAAQAAWASVLANGQVAANPNLGAAARIILNEVTSNNRSTLAGFTEVLGGRADVVLANPYGITCSGCGFLNTDRVTLTTGLPTLNADGSLRGFSVQQGDILVNGSGLNATAQQILDLVARTVRIDGAVRTSDLGITTGTNNWDYASRTVTGNAGAVGGADSYAIDSTALGGMYANRIRISATEAGVGVRMLGEAAATDRRLHAHSGGPHRTGESHLGAARHRDRRRRAGCIDCRAVRRESHGQPRHRSRGRARGDCHRRQPARRRPGPAHGHRRGRRQRPRAFAH
jgi:filamentous hemagglutinin